MKAIRNLIRMPQKSILLLSISLVLCFFMLAMIWIYMMAEDHLDSMVGPLGDCVEVVSNRGEPRLSVDWAEKITDSFDVIETFYAEAGTTGKFKGLGYFQTGKEEVSSGFVGEKLPMYVCAVVSTETTNAFFSGSSVITEGSGITAESMDAVVVSEAFAKLNGLSLGDSLELRLDTNLSSAGWQITVTVGGIYSFTQATAQDNISENYQIPENKVYIPFSAFVELYRSIDHECIPQKVYFKLNDASSSTVSLLNSRVSDILYRHAGLAGTELRAVAESKEAITMDRMMKTLRVSIVAVFLCQLGALLVVFLWSFQARRREMEIYRAIGAKKMGICGMFLREFGCILALAMLLSGVLFSVLVVRFGGTIDAFLYAESNGTIQTETSYSTLASKSVYEGKANEIFGNIAVLFERYLLPSILGSILSLFIALTVLGTVIAIRVRRQECLDGIGGHAG